MKLLIEVVRNTGTTAKPKLELVDSPTGNLLENALVAMAEGVASKLSSTKALHPQATQTYDERLAAFDATLKATYTASTEKAYDADYTLSAASTVMRFGVEETSIFIPKTNRWWTMDGRSYELAFSPVSDPTTAADLSQKYYLQIRAENAVSACEYTVSTDPLSSKAPGPDRFDEVTGKLRGVTLFLSHTRTVILGVDRVQDRRPQQGHASSPGFSDAKNVWILPEPPELTPNGDFVRVVVRFIGDPVHIRAATLLVAKGESTVTAEWSDDECAPFPKPPAVSGIEPVAELVSYGATWEMEMARRLCLLRKVPGDISPHIFFYELDKESTNDADFAALGAFLSTAYLVRARIYDTDGTSTLSLSPADLVDLEAPLAKAGMLVVDTLRTYLGTGSAIDFEAVEDAFMRFARGGLTIFDTHGAPNGVNMFAFAELARMHMTLDRSSSVWPRLFSIFACACEVFVRSYHAFRSSNRGICSYRVEFNPLGRRGPNAAEMRELSESWGRDFPKKTEERYSRLVHGALYDETLKAHKRPLVPEDYTPMSTP